MIKFFLILTAVLFVGILLLFFLWRSEKTKQKETQGKLESTIQILRKNRKEADEKINNLHDGDALGNALNGLHKHKN